MSGEALASKYGDVLQKVTFFYSFPTRKFLKNQQRFLSELASPSQWACVG